jgi:hypothetical protein
MIIDDARLALSMDPEARRLLRAALDAHDEAFKALRASKEALRAARRQVGTANDDVDATIAGMSAAIKALGAVNSAIGEANDALREAEPWHDAAITAALTANRAAIDLLNYLDKNDQRNN